MKKSINIDENEKFMFLFFKVGTTGVKKLQNGVNYSIYKMFSLLINELFWFNYCFERHVPYFMFI